MIKANHTPSPWMIVFDESEIEIISNASTRSVPVADIMLDEHTTFAPPFAEARANARLICAAPDLLAALEYAISWTDINYDTSAWIEVAIAAVRKAKGE